MELVEIPTVLVMWQAFVALGCLLGLYPVAVSIVIKREEGGPFYLPVLTILLYWQILFF